MPVRIRRATFRPWVPFSVRMPQPRPCSVSLARATASSASAKARTVTTGPKTSVWCSSALSGRSVGTIAGYRAPSGPPPPVRTRAPLPTASATRAATRHAAASSTSGPMTVPVRPGSPLGRSATLAVNRRVNSPASEVCTRTRSAHMQIWPEFMNAEAFTAWPRSASSSTITEFLPPSSSTAGLRCSAARAPMTRPTPVEPVKLTARTRGSAISVRAMPAASALSLVMTLRTPSGSPASRSTSATNRPHATGASLDGRGSANRAR